MPGKRSKEKAESHDRKGRGKRKVVMNEYLKEEVLKMAKQVMDELPGRERDREERGE